MASTSTTPVDTPRGKALSKSWVTLGQGYVEIRPPMNLWRQDRSLLDYERDTLYSVFAGYAFTRPDHEFLGAREPLGAGNFGPFKWISYKQAFDQIEQLGAGFVQLGSGLRRGENGAIFCNNSPEWVLAEYAMFRQCITTVPLYSVGSGPEVIAHILSQAEIRLAVCTQQQMASLIDAAEVIAKSGPLALKVVVRARRPLGLGEPLPAMDAAMVEKARSLGVRLVEWDEVMAMGKEHPCPATPPTPSDIHSIIYTSGTTAMPKGAVLPHRCWTMTADKPTFHKFIGTEMVHLSYLPLAHVYERAFVGTMIRLGSQIGFFSGALAKLFEDVEACRPTYFLGVPRVYKRLHDTIIDTVENSGWLKKNLFYYACSCKEWAEKNNTTTWINWDALVFNKIAAKLGGRCKLLVTAAAPIPGELAGWLSRVFCTEVVQIYGLSECGGGACSLMGEERNERRTSCGVPTISGDIRLVDVPELNYSVSGPGLPRGEIWLKGGSNMTHYYKEPEKTAEALTSDGWFKTGDIGQLNEDGSMSVIDRVKNMFKLAQGEYVQPEYLETLFQSSPMIGQAWIHGDSVENFVVAIVVPDFTTVFRNVRDNASKMPAEVVAAVKALSDSNVAKPLTDPLYRTICDAKQVRDMVMNELVRMGKANHLPGFQIPRAVWLEPEPFSTESGLTTPTLKLKRPKMLARYQPQITTLFQEVRAMPSTSSSKQ